VEIHGWEILWREGDRVRLRIACSSGTYIRALISDLHDAYCLELRRTAIGPFTLDNAWPTEGPATLLDILNACRLFVPSISLDDAEAAVMRDGRSILKVSDAPLVLATDESGAAIALAESRDSKAGATLRPIFRT
jgi:tRNA pseudouridine55 synthase